MFFQKMKKSFKKTRLLCFFGLQDYPLENPGYCTGSTATKKGRQMYRIFSEPFSPLYPMLHIHF